ncbi:HD domain-containing protein [Candidatus Micrarchaeota archaeon]|nr:HD domain-containing protein [Candidatus Micrarchaeota archaeon]
MKLRETQMTPTIILDRSRYITKLYDEHARIGKMRPHTVLHSKKVSDMAFTLMTQLTSQTNLSDTSKLFWTEAAKSTGLVHDIGKICFSKSHEEKGLPDKKFIQDILHHPVAGFHILGTSFSIADLEIDDFLGRVQFGVLHHHERWDGERFEFSFDTFDRPGYPHGFKEDKIEEVARVIHVVDVYDAGRSRYECNHRVRRDMLIDFIAFNKGMAFDPNVVDAFLEIEPSLNIILEHYEDRGEKIERELSPEEDTRVICKLNNLLDIIPKDLSNIEKKPEPNLE